MECPGQAPLPELLTPPLEDAPKEAEFVKRFKEKFRIYIASQFPCRALEARSMIESITTSPIIEQVPMSAMNDQTVANKYKVWPVLIPLAPRKEMNQTNGNSTSPTSEPADKSLDDIVNELVEQEDGEPCVVNMVRTFKGTKVPVDSYNGVIENNIDIEMFHTILRNFICRAVSDLNQAKTWLRLHRPDIIQQTKVQHNMFRTAEVFVTTAYDEVAECTRQIGLYYEERVKIICMLTKQPSSRDLWKTLKWIDRKEFSMCLSRLQTVQQAYTLTFDFVSFSLSEIEGDRPNGFGKETKHQDELPSCSSFNINA